MTSKKKISFFVAAALLISMMGWVITPSKVRADVTLSESQEQGLRIQFFASTWGLSGKWLDTDCLGISRTEDSEFNLKAVADTLGNNRDYIKRVRIDGFVRPKFSERYEITSNHNEDLKIWINDKLVVNYGIVSDMELTAGQAYKIELEMQNKGYNDIQIKWKSQSQTEEVIPAAYLRAPVEVADVTQNTVTNIQYNPKNDTDGDGIPDSWEKNGYAVSEGVIMPYEASIHKVKYVTDYKRSSTDGDPYSDFQEVTGIGMDQSVKAPGNDPLIPAYPILEFVPTGIKVIPSIQNRNVESVEIGSGSTEKITEVDMNSSSDGGYTKGIFKSKAELGFKTRIDSGKGEGYVGGYFKLDAAGGADWNSREGTIEEAKDIKEKLTKLSKNEKYAQTTSVDFTNYAYLQVNGYYKNTGTATAYGVTPIINLSIADMELEEVVGGNTIVKTFGVLQEQSPSLVGPNLRYPANGTVTLSLTTTTGNKLPEEIRLTKEQVDKLNWGYPFRIGSKFTSYREYGTTDVEKRWSSYITAIDEVCATVKLTLPKSATVERKIFAKNTDNPLNLVQALGKLFNGKINNSNNLVIDGEEITTSSAGDWAFRITVANQNDYNSISSLLNNGAIDYNKIILKPGMDIEVFKKNNAAEANILSAYYSIEDSRVYAHVIPGSEDIKTVKARIKAGQVKDITLTADEENAYEFKSVVINDISASYTNTLTVEANDGTTVQKKIFVDPEFTKIKAVNGLNYLKFTDNPTFSGYSNLHHKPFTSKTTRDAVKQFVQDKTDHKYYVITIGENLQRGVNNRQINQNINIGGNEIWNKSEVQMRKNRGQRVDVGAWYKIRMQTRNWDWLDHSNRDSGGFDTFTTGIVNKRTYFTRFNPEILEVKRSNDPDGTRTVDLKIVTEIKDRNGKRYGTVGAFVHGHYRVWDLAGRYPLTKAANNVGGVRGVVKEFRFFDVSPAAEHTQTAVVSREELLSYLGTDDGFYNSNSLEIEGIFTTSSEGKVFIPSIGSYVTIAGGTGSITNGFDQIADAVMINVKKTGGDHGVARFGDTNIALNNGSSTGEHQDMAIVSMSSNDTIYKKIANDKNLDVQVLGYYVDKSNLTAGQKYWQYWIPTGKIRTSLFPEFGTVNVAEEEGPSVEEALGQYTVSSGTERFMIPWKKLEVNGYPVKPKGFIVKVDQRGIGAKQMELLANGASYRMDTGAHKISSLDNYFRSNKYNDFNHTGYIFVKANNQNPYALDLKLNIDTPEAEGIQGQVNVQVVGFFYENLY